MKNSWLTGILALVVIFETGYLVLQKNDAVSPATESNSTSVTCDVGSLCLQESKSESGIFGVAQVTAHAVGEKSFNVMSDTESCSMMAVDSVNDPRVWEEIGATSDGQYLFAIPADTAKRFEGTTAASPVTLTVYIAERKGSDSSPCSERVHVLN